MSGLPQFPTLAPVALGYAAATAALLASTAIKAILKLRPDCYKHSSLYWEMTFRYAGAVNQGFLFRST